MTDRRDGLFMKNHCVINSDAWKVKGGCVETITTSLD